MANTVPHRQKSHSFENTVPEKPGVDHCMEYKTNALDTFDKNEVNKKFPIDKCEGNEMCFDSHTNGKKE